MSDRITEQLINAERQHRCSRPQRVKKTDGSFTWARCGSKSETECPFCAKIYRYDRMRLIGSGCNVQDKDGVTAEMLAPFDFYFVTLTAPSFGKIKDGSPMNPSRYLYRAQVEWNSQSSELFRRSMMYFDADLPDCEYAFVREWQGRGALHFHGIVRVPKHYKEADVWKALLKFPSYSSGEFKWGRQKKILKIGAVEGSVGYLSKVVSYTAKEQGFKGTKAPDPRKADFYKRLDRAARRVPCGKTNCSGVSDKGSCLGVAHKRFGYGGHMTSFSKNWSFSGLTGSRIALERQRFVQALGTDASNRLSEFSEVLLGELHDSLDWSPGVNKDLEQELLAEFLEF